MMKFDKLNPFKRSGSKSPSSDSSVQESVREPEEFDVLCGKDKTYGKHPGNKAFRALIEITAKKYQMAETKQEKMRFTREIVTTMRNNFNARFLKRVKTSDGSFAWQEISEAMARDKVSHALRFAANNKRKTSGSSEMTDSSSSTCGRARMSSSTMPEPLLEPPTTTIASELLDQPMDESPVFLDKVDGIFRRQQAILGNLRGGALPAETNHSMTAAGALLGNFVSNHSSNGSDVSLHGSDEEDEEQEEKFDTLRSQDFDEMLSEPLTGMRINAPAQDGLTEEYGGASSLRSEDLNLLLREPLHEKDWAKGMGTR